jgi:DNA-damage-inducible protein D
MANTDKLAEVAALLAERDEEFRPFELAKVAADTEEPYWALSDLKRLLGYGPTESIDKAVNKAKVSASNAGISIREHFRDGTLFDHPGEVFVSKYAAILIAMNADVRKTPVAVAQNYFALQVDRQRLEDEKRLRGRFDVATENHKLQGVASEAGVNDFKKFNGVGVSALYGGRSVIQIQAMKGLGAAQSYLDYAGSEELAANLFRITQTAAALRRQEAKSEALACGTHQKVARGVRQAIIDAGNTPPEQLPPAKTKIDKLATEVKRTLKST